MPKINLRAGQCIIGVFVLTILLGLGLRPLLAHGGGELVVGLEPAGPYAVSVWINPPQTRVDEPVHFTVGLSSLADGNPVLDAEVLVEMQLVGAETDASTSLNTSVTAAATTAQSTNKLFYETDLDVESIGTYNTTINIQGVQGQGDISISVLVAEANPINWLWVGLLGLGVALIFVYFQARRQTVTLIHTKPADK